LRQNQAVAKLSREISLTAEVQYSCHTRLKLQHINLAMRKNVRLLSHIDAVNFHIPTCRNAAPPAQAEGSEIAATEEVGSGLQQGV